MLSPADARLIEVQTHRPPRGIVSVAAHCPAGHPAVAHCYPLLRKAGGIEPFPTLYWLTCPRLRREISHFERDGAITEIAGLIAGDAGLRERLARDHEDYIARRWATLTQDDRALVNEMGLAEQFRTRGIGGMVNRAAVKCLHLHFAHHLAAENVIGEIMIKRYGIATCASVANAPFSGLGCSGLQSRSDDKK